MSNTCELFSRQSDAYRANRPTYDPALFVWLSQQAPDRTLAWDCGCGSGQATVDLARHFERVVGTDVNAQQLAKAEAAANIEYRCEPAEATSLTNASVSLTVVAQALHWFDLDRFYAEVRRVSQPGGQLAVISYNLLQITPELDALVNRLYYDILGPYWAEERKHVEQGYRTLPFPFERIEVPVSALNARWDLTRLLGYLESWSALATYQAIHGRNPLDSLRAQFEAAWGKPGALREVSWPLTVNLGRVA
ncbi:class I SAM-dependent methyltransferase [Metapseudomonas boanensis]|uniref:Class I SAM-dependent methyltransferase n=1 Tax=Metapseudomonas boanensis TaxID=2822138 RepID=A0ABS5XPB8_9GAMM|nr:class I SAM-dependent methyltransferase [Pseudomonas boanensis]MBT8769539.1 class I SAM-dependent methyltransferase [Pseudomonas boanensis]